jgi:hypothetical protein
VARRPLFLLAFLLNRGVQKADIRPVCSNNTNNTAVTAGVTLITVTWQWQSQHTLLHVFETLYTISTLHGYGILSLLGPSPVARRPLVLLTFLLNCGAQKADIRPVCSLWSAIIKNPSKFVNGVLIWSIFGHICRVLCYCGNCAFYASRDYVDRKTGFNVGST